jgi:hypothetical protein
MDVGSSQSTWQGYDDAGKQLGACVEPIIRAQRLGALSSGLADPSDGDSQVDHMPKQGLIAMRGILVGVACLLLGFLCRSQTAAVTPQTIADLHAKRWTVRRNAFERLAAVKDDIDNPRIQKLLIRLREKENVESNMGDIDLYEDDDYLAYEGDGRRPKATFQTSQMPYFAEGGFAGLVGFKRWEQRECFDYVVTSGDGGHTVRLEMTLKVNSANPSCTRLPAGFHRIVIADPETGRILHTERTIAPEAAARNTGVYFGGIDYAPQKLGEQTFWLPSRFYAHDANNTARMFATYSNCHRYAGELKILPGYVLSGAGQQHR